MAPAPVAAWAVLFLLALLSDHVLPPAFAAPRPPGDPSHCTLGVERV